MLYSVGLKRAIAYAEEAARESDVEHLSPDFLMLGLLKVLDECDKDLLGDPFASGEEIGAYRVLKHHRFLEDGKDAYGAFVSRFDTGNKQLYEQVLRNAAAMAVKRGDAADAVGLEDLANALLSSPTDRMKRFLLAPSEEEEEDKAPTKKFSLSEAIAKASKRVTLTAPVVPQADDDNDNSDDDDDLLSDDEEDEEEEDQDDTDELFEKLWASLDMDDDEEKQEREPISGARRLAAVMDDVKEIRGKLLGEVYGQDAAVNSFIAGYFKAAMEAEFKEERKKPKATFLFAGPPGVGKTFLAETAADALGLPFARFDMSEYADKEANIEFCGSDKVYKNGKAGNVTSFVEKNPKCVLLFDEIEKAHLVAIHLFLQILDAGRLRDNYTDREVSFRDAIIIFTTNAGKNLYDETTAPLSTLSRKKILKALSADINPLNDKPLFPAAICSRFASGNVVMFDHLGAFNLFRIARREILNNAIEFERGTDIKVEVDESVISSVIFAEGGQADARAVKGRAGGFFHEEMYELLRLLGSAEAIEGLKKISFTVTLPEDTEIKRLFGRSEHPAVLVFGDPAVTAALPEDGFTLYRASTLEQAKEILYHRDIAIVLCDVSHGIRRSDAYLNLEDVDSEGRDLLSYVTERLGVPLFLLLPRENALSEEELLSFARLGARGEVGAYLEHEEFVATVKEKTDIAVQQSNMERLAKASKVLRYKTAQTVSEDGTEATVSLFDLCLSLAPDTKDERSLSATVSRPTLRFSDVIGAEDAKGELSYFVEYLKNPVAFMRKGVKAPKGVLLYGPPGTGKTMLAKAMAGESDVTFLVAEGNSFLKRYVGEGADAVHSLFATARKYAPSILFIDEIDAIAKERTSADTTGDVLTALLTEMDGFNTDTGKPVFVLAATNYGVDGEDGKALDGAMIRRFDRKIKVDLPTKDERRRYIGMLADKTPALSLSEGQIENIAVRSTGMSLALLEQVVELALRNAIRSKNNEVDDAAFEEAFETYQSGEKKAWNDALLLRVARHEAGHALISYLGGECPSYLTVVARGDHGGYMQHADGEDKQLYTRDELLTRIRTSLGGRAAEIVCYGPKDGISTGASGDLRSATATAKQMICVYGMDETLGLAVLTDELTAAAEGEVRARINAILSEQLAEAVRLLEKHRAALDALVTALVERNRLKDDEIRAILAPFVG